jgi:hypothetical protein
MCLAGTISPRSISGWQRRGIMPANRGLAKARGFLDSFTPSLFRTCLDLSAVTHAARMEDD